MNWLRERQRLIINSFIILNILAIVIGCTQVIHIPLEIRKIFYPYLRLTRLAQSWYLFAPEPKRVAIEYRVDIRYKDQSTTSWKRPYPGNWDFFDRHLAYQFQKFDLGANHLMKDDEARKDYCTYVMKLHWNEANPPQSLTLVQEKANWPAPRDDRPLTYDKGKLRWSDIIVKTFQVEGKTLK